MIRLVTPKPSSIAADFFIFFFLIILIYGIGMFGIEWKDTYNPSYDIDLSLSSLPIYSVFSALRGLTAYIASLIFTIVIGYWAAKSPRAEKIILPFLDIMQSIPVLGFLPGLVLGLVAIFPNTNVGLELASILMIFTGQVWNMAFAFYSSLKSVPTDLQEAAAVMKLSSFEKLKVLELPYSAMNLTWNSLMSMAGGWFFLTVCEAFTLGNKPYRLPGVGAYMAVAIDNGNTKAIIAGIIAMFSIIILFDILLWRPALIWAHKFRLEDSNSVTPESALIQLLIKNSFVAKLIKRAVEGPKGFKFSRLASNVFSGPVSQIESWFGHFPHFNFKKIQILIYLSFFGFAGWSLYHLSISLAGLNLATWTNILTNTFYTFCRVMTAVIIGSLWATPIGIWIAQSPARLKIAQPLIQLMASFPAPMLYPLAIALFLFLNINFEIAAMLLMLLGVQWYILFNVLAGALRIPNEINLAMSLMGSSTYSKWRYLFLPSVFPSLVTGWITAAGGAWNASIVSEVISYKGQSFEAHGLGAEISKAAANADFPKLSACLLLMVIVVVILNRTVWAKIYRLAQTRFRLDL